MALAVRSFPWATQPPPELARPRAPGWGALILPAGNGALDVVGGGRAVIAGSVSVAGASPFGPRSVQSPAGNTPTSAAGNGAAFPIGYPAVLGAAVLSMFAVVVFRALSVSTSIERFILRYDAPNNAGSGSVALDYFVDASTGTSFRIRPLISTTGTTGWTASNDASFTVPTLNTPYLVAMRWPGSGVVPSVTLAKLGTAPAFAAGSIAPTGVINARAGETDGRLYVGGAGVTGSGTTGNIEGDVLMAGVTQRYVTDPEWTAISINPWAMFA